MPLDTPAYNAIPFAQDGLKNTIPNSTASEGAASFTQGFPPETMNPINAGGVPPAGRDMNGILNQLSSHQVWLNAGGMYKFDAALATAIGGYKVGAVVQSDDSLSAYVCTVDGTTSDPNDLPLPAGWSPWIGLAAEQASENRLFDRLYPVGGAPYLSLNSANPATYLGRGTWIAWGGGTHLSFVGTSDSVTLSAGVSGSHTHEITLNQLPEHRLKIASNTVTAGSDFLRKAVVGGGDEAYILAGTGSEPDTYSTSSVGAGEAIPIRPRTTTIYGWIRTA